MRLRRAHERLRAASKDLQALIATSPIRGRWEPTAAPAGILQAVRAELSQAYAALSAHQSELLGWTERDDDWPGAGAPIEAVEVLEDERVIAFSFADLMRYHGSGSPGGVAHAFKVMQRGFPLLEAGSAPQRREISIATSFGGPGARDGFEAVTRAVTSGRYTVDPALARPELGAARERFVFRLASRGSEVTLSLRDGQVSDEFAALTQRERSSEDDARLDVLKAEMAHRLMARGASDVYDVT